MRRRCPACWRPLLLRSIGARLRAIRDAIAAGIVAAEANARRISACVSACAGVTDPQPGELDKLRWHDNVMTMTVGELQHLCQRVERERDAYAKAKAENDERFMCERDEARAQRDKLAEALRAFREAHAIESEMRDAALDAADCAAKAALREAGK